MPQLKSRGPDPSTVRMAPGLLGDYEMALEQQMGTEISGKGSNKESLPPP
jgi:hypothetical protein